MKLFLFKSIINIFMGVCWLMAVTSCESRPESRKPKPCDCSSGITIEDKTLLAAEELPSDLTRVAATRKTIGELIGEITTLYNALHGTNVELEKGDDEWEDLNSEIRSWLGGMESGDCGNLVDGLTITGYKGLGEKVGIDIKTVETEILKKQAEYKKAPFLYHANVTLSVKMTSKGGDVKEGERITNQMTVATCNRYAAVM